MRGVVSLAAAFAVPLTTLSGEEFPGRPQLVFLTFVVVIGTLLLHGLTLPWLIRRLDVQGDDAAPDALAAAAAQTKAAQRRVRPARRTARRAAPGYRRRRARRRGSARVERLGAATRRGSGWAAATTRSARARRRRSGGCGSRCWPPSAKHSSPNATPGTSTTRCCGRCCTDWISRKRRSTGPDGSRALDDEVTLAAEPGRHASRR